MDLLLYYKRSNEGTEQEATSFRRIKSCEKRTPVWVRKLSCWARIWVASRDAPATLPVWTLSLRWQVQAPRNFIRRSRSMQRARRLLLGTVGGLSESLDRGNTASIVPGAAVTANSDAAVGVWPSEQRRAYLCRRWNSRVCAHHCGRQPDGECVPRWHGIWCCRRPSE